MWQTLLLERNGWGLRRRSVRCESLSLALNKLGLEISAEQLSRAFEKLDCWLVNVWKDDGEVTHEDQIRFLVQAASEEVLTIEKKCLGPLSSAYASAIFTVPPYLNPEAPRVLQWLKDHHKRVGLICNVGLTPGFALRKFLEREGVAKYFDVMIFSDEAGLRKPDPRIFHKASAELQIETYQIVHIGDNRRCDVWGAKNAGFRTIHLYPQVGRDRIAESDPKSLISTSRKLSNLHKDQVTPDKTINSLTRTIDTIKELQTRKEPN